MFFILMAMDVCYTVYPMKYAHAWWRHDIKDISGGFPS